LLPQIAEGTLLGRGALLKLSRPHLPRRARTAVSQASVRAAEALAGQPGAETWLPIATDVVLVLLDQLDPTAAQQGDLTITVAGGQLASPLRIPGGRRRALLYQVIERDPKARQLAISTLSDAAFALAGVVGLAGRAAEWAARFDGGVPEVLVPSGPLTPEGRITVWFDRQGRGTP
jgi:hypothetical protein